MRAVTQDAVAPPRAAVGRPLVSIVIPVFRGQHTIGPLVEELLECAGARWRLEIILVNDGSPDRSADACRGLAQRLPGVRFVNLAQLQRAQRRDGGAEPRRGRLCRRHGRRLQNPPQEVPKLLVEIEKGYDVVYARYAVKHHSPLRNLGSRVNDRVACWLLDKPRDLYLSSFKAMSRFLVDELVKYDGPYPYVDGLVLRVTRCYSQVTVEHQPRRQGSSGYTARRLVSLYLNMLTNFSILPLRLASYAGILTALAGLILAGVFVIDRLRHPEVPAGWASVIVSLFIIGGIQLFALGMIGEYLGRLFLKDNGRPQFVVRERVNCVPRVRKERQ